MQNNNGKNEQEQQSFLQSQIAVAEILGEIQDAKETARKPKISMASKEKAKIYFEKNRTQKMQNYFLIAGFYVMFLIFGNTIEKNTISIYEIATAILFGAMTINSSEKSELGYVRKMLSETDNNTLETVTFYLFDKVPAVRYVTLIIIVSFLMLLPFLMSIMIPDLTNISIYLCISLSLIFASFNEFIFKGYLK